MREPYTAPLCQSVAMAWRMASVPLKCTLPPMRRSAVARQPQRICTPLRVIYSQRLATFSMRVSGWSRNPSLLRSIAFMPRHPVSSAPLASTMVDSRLSAVSGMAAERFTSGRIMSSKYTLANSRSSSVGLRYSRLIWPAMASCPADTLDTPFDTCIDLSHMPGV